MGERLSGDGDRGRRRVRPRAAVSGSWDAGDAAALELALAAAMRAGDLDPEAEQRALTAYRDARGAGAHRARTRRRDDWRRPAERRAGRGVKMTFGVVFASLALGGAAVAAIGSAGSSADGPGAGGTSAHPSALASGGPGGGASSASSGGSRTGGGPASAQDTEAHCRAYEQVKDRGQALDATAWQQLLAAAGGKNEVAAYCTEQLARATATPSGTAKPAAGAGNGTSGNTGTSGNSTSRTNPGTADNTAGNGRTSGDKGSGKHR